MKHALLAGWLLGVLSLSTWAAEPVAVTAGKQPQLAVDDEGRVYLAYGQGSAVYCARSTDGGKTFAAAAKVGEVGKLALGARRGPRIAVHGDNVIITAIGGKIGRGKDENLLAYRSTDGGANWSEAVAVNDVPAAAREGLHDMAATKDKLFCVWLDLRNGRTELAGSLSTDGGQTWGKNQLIYGSPAGSICECCHPSAVFDAKGTLYVMWRNSINGLRDMYACTSRDGRKFTPARKLGTGSWRLDACPMDGGYLAVDAQGGVTTVWRRDEQVFATTPRSRGEQLLGPGQQPWVAAGRQGAFVVWLARGGDLMLAAPKAKQPARLAGKAGSPVITGNVAKGPVVAAWESGGQIMVAVVGE